MIEDKKSRDKGKSGLESSFKLLSGNPTAIERLDLKIRTLKNSYLGQNDFRRTRIEIEKKGGKWKADNGITYEIIDGAIFAYEHEDGITELMIMAYDAYPEPYVAYGMIDMQHIPQEKRKDVLAEFKKKEAEKKAKKGPEVEIITITIVEKDWLSKISLKRWGTIDWKKHLEPTPETLNSPKRIGKGFNPDLIYPGDTFFVK